MGVDGIYPQRRHGPSRKALGSTAPVASAVLVAAFLPKIIKIKSKIRIYMGQHSKIRILTSLANTASGGAVESIHDALIEITKWPPFLRKYCAFKATILA